MSRQIMVVAALAFAVTAWAAPAFTGRRAYPQHEGLDVNAYLTVTPKPKVESYAYCFHRVGQPVLVAQGEAKDPRVIEPFRKFMKDGLGIEVPVNPRRVPPSCDLRIGLSIKTAADAPFTLPAHPHPDNPEGYVLKIAPGQ